MFPKASREVNKKSHNQCVLCGNRDLWPHPNQASPRVQVILYPQYDTIDSVTSYRLCEWNTWRDNTTTWKLISFLQTCSGVCWLCASRCSSQRPDTWGCWGVASVWASSCVNRLILHCRCSILIWGEVGQRQLKQPKKIRSGPSAAGRASLSSRFLPSSYLPSLPPTGNTGKVLPPPGRSTHYTTRLSCHTMQTEHTIHICSTTAISSFCD